MEIALQYFIIIAVSLLPVFLFLTALIFLDSFKLVRIRSILQFIFVGAIIAVLCMQINSWMAGSFSIDAKTFSRYIAPFIEELFKAGFIIILIHRKRIGFMVDSAIFGFAIGAGFATVENIEYLFIVESKNVLLWIVRGFGTAVMHGGTTAIFAIISKMLIDRYRNEKFFLFLPGIMVAIIVHSFFNHFFFPPQIITIMQLIILPTLFFLIYNRSENILREWLEEGLDTDVQILEYINSGTISKTNIGNYLHLLKDKFSGEIIADMLCFVGIQYELAVRAKGVLMMKEAGFPIKIEEDIKEKFIELDYLKKSIGKTGLRALSPVVHGSTQDIWQIYFLDT